MDTGLHFARRSGAAAIAVEDLEFTDGKSREKHGRNKCFRRLISRFPATKLKARHVPMAAEQNVAIVAADPAHTSRWGAPPGRNRSPPHAARPPGRTPPASPSGDAPSGILPHSLKGMGIPPSAPDGTAPCAPERCTGASDRPGWIGDPTA